MLPNFEEEVVILLDTAFSVCEGRQAVILLARLYSVISG